MNLFYKLDKDKNIIECTYQDFIAFSRTKNKIIKQQKVSNKFISTVFLGIDHSFAGDKKLLFETVIFPKEHSMSELYMDRYSTYEEALEGHEKAVNFVKSGALKNVDNR